MFGKFKAIKGKAQKFLGKSLQQLDKGSLWLGKTIHKIQKGYRQGKSFIEHNADKLDKVIGSEGAVREIANRAINVVEGNPFAQAASASLNEAKVVNKIVRKNVINNPQLKSFISQ